MSSGSSPATGSLQIVPFRVAIYSFMSEVPSFNMGRTNKGCHGRSEALLSAIYVESVGMTFLRSADDTCPYKSNFYLTCNQVNNVL